MRLLGRTTQITPSPITEAHAWLAERTGTRPLIDLSQAAPGYPPPPAVIERIIATARQPDGARYCATSGLPALTQAFAAELSRDYQAEVPADHILPTSGCNQAFCITASALAEPGDEIILPAPYYFNHDMWLKLDGIQPVYLETAPTLVPDPEAAEALITDKTRAMVLVSPGNPTGVTVPPSVITDFFDLAAERNIALIVDETYRNFRDTTERPHDLYQRPGWAETAVLLHSFSKDLAIPGYRVGAMVAGPRFLDEAMKLLDCVQISAPRIGQEAVVGGLTESGDWRSLQANRILGSLEKFREIMAGEPGGFRLASSGAFFGWVQHPFPHLSTAEVVRKLVLEHDVLVIPGTAFTPTDDGWLRFSFANLSDDQLPLLAERLTRMGEFNSATRFS